MTFRFGGVGEGETLVRLGVGMSLMLSSPRKVLELVVIFGRGGSIVALGISWLYVVRFVDFIYRPS